MKALRTLRTLTILSPKPCKTRLYPSFLYRFYSAQPQEDEPTNNPTISDSEDGSDSVFDSTYYTIPSIGSEPSTQVPQQPTWDKRYRQKADKLIFGEEAQKRKLKILEEEEEERRRRVLAKALLEAALEPADDEDEEEDMVVKEEDQKSLSVGIIGVPNAGKSALTNNMVGFLAIDTIFRCWVFFFFKIIICVIV
jgi:GTP-binding protein Era